MHLHVRTILACLFCYMPLSAVQAQRTTSNSTAAAPLQTESQATKSLQSFKKLDDLPLFEMHFYGDYAATTTLAFLQQEEHNSKPWACSLFVSYGENGEAVFGRNFDWTHNPALVLHTNPSDGYASVSTVDISYLGFARNDSKFDTVEGRRALLRAPMLPFDGMNEHGLVVGMAAVGPTEVPDSAEKPDVGSLQMIRIVLDHAKTTKEALAIFDKYDIRFSGGPRIHYLIADTNGHSALVELKDGQKHVQQNTGKRWQAATNFYMTNEASPLKQCPRFARISRMMNHSQQGLAVDQAFDLLKDVAQPTTRWSNVYDMKRKSVEICTSRNFQKRHVVEVASP